MKRFLLLLSGFILLLPSLAHSRGKVDPKDRVWYGYTFVFWAIFILLYFLYSRYKNAKNKKAFFRSSFMQAVFWPTIMIFVVLLLMNLFGPRIIAEKTTQVAKRALQLPQTGEENVWRKKVEQDFTNPDLTYQYIKYHYSKNPAEEDNYEIQNFYQDKTLADDPEYQNIGHLGLAYCFYHTKGYKEGMFQLESISDRKLKYVNYLKGCVLLEERDTINALSFLEKELTLYGKKNENVIRVLTEVYMAQHDYKSVYTLIKEFDADVYIRIHELRKIYIANNDIIEYTYLEGKRVVSYLSIPVFLSAFLITLAWLYYLYKVDLYQKENPLYIVLTFLFGCVFCFFAIPLYDIYKMYFNFQLNGEPFNDFLYSIFGIGAIEELVKIIPMLIILNFSDQIDEPYDYILYACVSALGFAFVENLMYLQYDSLFIIQARGMQAVIGHMCDSAIFAYGMVLARYRYNNFNRFLAFFLSYFTAATFHGLYDFFLFEESYIAFLALFYFEVGLFTLIINNCLNNSSFFTYEDKPHKHKLEFVLSVSLISILLFQYIMNAFQHGVDEANGGFLSSLSYGVMLIPYFVYKLSRLDLVKGYWFGYYEVKDSYKIETPMASFVNMIAGTSIKPSNYVGMKLNFRPGRENYALKSFMPGMIAAVVKERLIIRIRQQGLKEYKDPYWFLIETEQAVHFPEGSFSKFVIRFTRKGTDLNHVAEEEARLYLIAPELLTSGKEIRNVDLVKKGIIRVSVLEEEFN